VRHDSLAYGTALQSQPKTMDDLFEGTLKPRLEVPTFQRGYSWKGKHLDAFWKDLMGFIEEKKAGLSTKYFLGPIVILERPKDNVLEILDGQQRLATATIIFAAIRDIAKEIGTDEFERLANGIQTAFIAKTDAGDHLGFSLILGALDKDYFSDTVQSFPTKPATIKLKSHRNISTAQRTITGSIRTAISSLPANKKMKWLKELRDTVRADLIMTYIPVEKEREAFQIFETLNDRGLRLSVPDLLLNYLMKEAKTEDRDDIRACWDHMTERMGQRSIGQFLRHVWVSEFGDLKKQDLFTALKEHIESKGTLSKAYAKQCSTQCETYCALIDFDEKKLKSSTVHVRNLLRGISCDPALPLLLAVLEKITDAGLEKLVRCLLIFTVRHSVVAGMEATELESLFFSLAKKVRGMITEETKESEWLAYIKDELMKKNPSSDKIMSSMESLDLSSREATYLLTRIAEAMDTKTKEWKLGEANLEHIFPENPSDEWPNRGELAPLLWNIGNLTMLGERLNEKNGNRGFEFKRERYESASEIKMAQEIAKKHTKWDAGEVIGRALALGEWIDKVWDFNNPSRV
jgi:uncharacterized protein DUF262/uncharacterized protein DUF1524